MTQEEAKQVRKDIQEIKVILVELLKEKIGADKGAEALVAILELVAEISFSGGMKRKQFEAQCRRCWNVIVPKPDKRVKAVKKDA